MEHKKQEILPNIKNIHSVAKIRHTNEIKYYVINSEAKKTIKK